MKNRASRADIFNKLKCLRGPEAQTVIGQVLAILDASEKDSAIATLKAYDATIGGIGLPPIMGKPPGVYRPLGYVEFFLRNDYPREMSRFIIDAACGHVENLLKRMSLLGVFARIASNTVPMGALVRQVRGRLPPQLYQDLQWLASEVYNFAKHDFDVSKSSSPEEKAHYFELDEALAVVIISRQLAVDLEKFSGKTREELLKE